MMNRFTLFILMCLAIHLHAQNSAVFVRTFHTGDSVMLRWVPSDYTTAQQGNVQGYRITRFGMDEYLDLNGQDLSGKGTVIAESIKPLGKNDTMWNHLSAAIPQASFVYNSIFVPVKTTGDVSKRKQAESITFGFSMKACDDHVELAKAAGLFFTDHTAKKGEKYVYRVELLALPGKPTIAGVASADESLSQLLAVQNPVGQFRNRSMRITFDVARTRDQYCGYIIERSEDSVNYTRINKELLSFVRSQYETDKHELVYEDSLPQNGKKYWYRVRGFSYFGITGPASVAIHGKGKDEWNVYPAPDTCYSPDNKKVIIRWSLPPVPPASVLKGVCILRSDKVNGKYYPLSAALITATTFTDTAAQFTNYYQLVAISADGDSAFSFPFLAQLQDNDPPPVPTGLNGTVDTNGIVHLSWATVTAGDLKGYRVFRCNSLREEFVEISDSVIAATTITDTITLETLTRDVYYAVRSVDRVWNNSDFSTPLLLKRPDRIAPVCPLVRAVYHTDSTVVLQWINSTSDDVKSKTLARTSPSGRVIMKTFSASDTVSTFVDATAQAGTVYTYQLAVSDSSGNTTTLSFPQVNFSPRVRPAVQSFAANADLEKRIIRLSWDLPANAVDRFVIYKGKEGESARTFKTLSGTTTTYIDNQLYPGNVYIYKIKAVMKDGAETTLSEVKVNF